MLGGGGSILAAMKKWWIIVVGAIVAVSFCGLLALQGRYAEMMVKMRRNQFDESVKRSLDQAARDLEHSETYHYLDSIVSEYSDELIALDTSAVHPLAHGIYNPTLTGMLSQREAMKAGNEPSLMPHALNSPINFRLQANGEDAISQSAENFQRAVRNAYVYQRSVLDRVIYAIMYNASQKSFEERISPRFLDACLRMSLERNGVTLPFHFRVCTSDGREVYRCPDYDDTGSRYSYTQTLFSNDPSTKMGVVVVHFPGRGKYLVSLVGMMAPTMVFTVILFLIFIVTVYLLVHQRKVTEMKNDFVNNMTHEFKTPISSISLAAQMLADKSVRKTETMYERLGNVIYNESKRLRFQVEKVLQMSLYESASIALKPVELNADETIDSVVRIFTLKVEQSGGSIETRLEAENPIVSVDEMHFTNVVFNLMENAVKYRRDDVALKLTIITYNSDDNYCLSVEDNGIGLRKEDLKQIFERFYRVHTGNRHNVKGFGLGLAYVKKMVELHHGTIKAESEYGKWTRFIITIPNTKG